MEKVDYLIRNGHLIDCYQNISREKDIAVKNGKIVSADNVEAVHEIDASGCIVTPGLIDFHCHVGAFVTELGIVGEAVNIPLRRSRLSGKMETTCPDRRKPL